MISPEKKNAPSREIATTAKVGRVIAGRRIPKYAPFAVATNSRDATHRASGRDKGRFTINL